MFSGIIETTGRIIESSERSGGLRLTVDVSGFDAAPKSGESVALDGVCLTVVDAASKRCTFDVVAETLRRSNFGQSCRGRRVNLERSVRVGARLDGHLVQGHVDATATADEINSRSQDWMVWFSIGDGLAPLIVPKGSIAVNGVSLTIAEVTDDRFSVALIPTTLERTNLSELQVGDRVNLETDIMARTILHQLGILLSGDSFEHVGGPLRGSVLP